jgi:hypothetical protein
MRKNKEPNVSFLISKRPYWEFKLPKVIEK